MQGEQDVGGELRDALGEAREAVPRSGSFRSSTAEALPTLSPSQLRF